MNYFQGVRMFEQIWWFWQRNAWRGCWAAWQGQRYTKQGCKQREVIKIHLPEKSPRFPMQRGILQAAELFPFCAPLSSLVLSPLSQRQAGQWEFFEEFSTGDTTPRSVVPVLHLLGTCLHGKCDQNSYFGISFLWCHYSRGKRFYSRWITLLRRALAGFAAKTWHG